MFRSSKAGRFLLIAAIVVLTIFLIGWWAWFDHLSGNEAVYGQNSVPAPWQVALDAAYSALRAFAVGDEYARLFAATNNGPPPGDWRLEFARFGGIAVFYIAIIFGILTLLARPLRHLRARWRRKHLVILGETETARHVAEMWLQLSPSRRFARQVTYHASAAQSLPDKVLVLPRTEQLSASAMLESVKGANRVVVAETHDAMTTESALEIARHMPDTPVFAVLADPWLAQRVRHGLQPDLSPLKSRSGKRASGDLLSAISLNACAARSLLHRHPPFAIAMKNRHPRVHAVIVGLDGLGEAILLDILNSSLVIQLAAPAITVIDIAAEKRINAFRARHPGLDEHFNLIAIQADITSLDNNAITAVRARAGEFPVTAVYVTTSEKSPALKGAIAIREAALREGLFDAPVFLRASEGAGLPEREGGVDFHSSCELISFGSWKEIMHATGMLEDLPDRLARDYHEAYAALTTSSPASTAWSTLDELSRLSSRRAVDHIPAKLASLGFDLETYLRQQRLACYNLPSISKDESLFRNATELVNLAKLEHERWMFDRWMNGWRYGATRDDKAFIHDHLVPFEELDDEVKVYDVQLVDWLSSHIKKTRDGIRRRVDAADAPIERKNDVILVDKARRRTTASQTLHS
ncbi:RyR domain-containing protein [Glycocaulis abyssi]|uniref:RyR domain-containing protein n=1 Tax=Glycocaulis abyssi TaxID=1433403 RepID=A0ABV9NHX8_9PROT